MKADLIITDMDGTAVQYPIGEFASSWDALARFLSDEKKFRWFSLTRKYYGKGNYESWFQEQVSLLAGKTLADAHKVLFPIPYSPGFADFFSNSNGLKKAILSAGVDIVAEKITEELHFDYWVAQYLEIQDGVFTGRGRVNVDYRNKSVFLPEIARRFDASLQRTCYVGDTEGDKSCMELVGVPVAFKPHHGLEEYAKQRNIPCIDDFRQLNGILKEK